MTRRSIFRSLLGLSAVALATQGIRREWWSGTDATPMDSRSTDSTSQVKTACYAVNGGRLVFRGYTEDMDCPFPPEPWP